MATVPLVAVHAFPYAGGTIVAGEAFDAQSAQDATLLKAIGHAVDAPSAFTKYVMLLATQKLDPPAHRRRRKRAEDV
jgi:hypothetical protein